MVIVFCLEIFELNNGLFLKQTLSYPSSFLASGDFCHLLINFANRLNPDQDGRSVDPDLDPNCLAL